MNAIIKRVEKVFNDKGFRRSVENSGRDNWLRIKASVAFDRILKLLNEMK